MSFDYQFYQHEECGPDSATGHDVIGALGASLLISRSDRAEGPFLGSVVQDPRPGKHEATQVEPVVTDLTTAAVKAAHPEIKLNLSTRFAHAILGITMGHNSLYFVKYFNVGAGKMEVHSVSGASGYSTFTMHAVTPSSTDDGYGIWTVEDGNAYYIKTRSTGTNTIEVHRLSKASNYGAWDIHSGSGFSIKDADNGTWTIDGADLYFIKTRNTPGSIEIHRGNHNQGFAINLHQETTFPLEQGYNATVTMRSGDLYLIKTCGTTSGKVEVYIATRASQYQTITFHITAFSVADGHDGFWEINDAGDLYFIKTRHVESGRIEVHFASKGTDYKPISGHYVTAFDALDARAGYWIVDPVAE